MFYFASCMNIIFNSLLAQLVKYDVHTTRKIKSIHAIFITYCLFCLTSVVHVGFQLIKCVVSSLRIMAASMPPLSASVQMT